MIAVERNPNDPTEPMGIFEEILRAYTVHIFTYRVQVEQKRQKTKSY